MSAILALGAEHEPDDESDEYANAEVEVAV